MAVDITFMHPALTGTVLPFIGSGTYDHVRFSAATSGAGVISGFFQQTSWISDDAGVVAAGPGTSGQLVNNKRISSTGVAITAHSGGTVAFSGALNSITGGTAGLPDFDLRPSGTIFIKIASDDASVFFVNLAEVWVDDGSVVTNAPTGMTVYAVEYDKDGSNQSSWTPIGGSGAAITMKAHTAANGYSLATDHYFAIALSATPTTSGIITGRINAVFEFSD